MFTQTGRATRKFVIVVTSVIAISLTGGLASQHSQGQKPSVQTEVATPVHEGVRSDQQKEHSKLYNSYKGQGKLSDRVKSKNELTVNLHAPLPVLSPDSKQTSTVTELAEKADAVVIANVISKSAQITTSGTFVFTDYQLNVEEVLRADSDKLKPQTSITVTRPGGKVLLEGQVITFKVESFKPLMPGHRYLLFLKVLPITGTYQAVDQKSSFDISDSKVQSLSDAPDAQGFEKDLGTFISSVKVAIASSQKYRGAK